MSMSPAMLAGGFLEVPADEFISLTEELQCQVLERMLGAFGGSVRLAKIEAALGVMARMKNGGRHALGGVIIRRGEDRFRLYRETDREMPTTVVVRVGPKGNKDVVWDGRLLLSFRADVSGAVRLRALSPSEVEVLRLYFRDSGEEPPVTADEMRGLCSVWQGSRGGNGEALVAIPQLDEGVQESVLAAMSVAGFQVVGHKPGGTKGEGGAEKMDIGASFPLLGWEAGR